MTDTVERLRADWKQYRRTQIAELRPYRSGETLNGRVSISAEDRAAGSPKPGDMIARNPKNHQDQWLVAAQYFADNFEDVNDTQMLWDAVAEKNAEIERLRKRERRLAARVKQLHDIIQADRGPDFYIPAPDEAAA